MNYVLNEDGSIKVGPNGQPLVKGEDGKEFEIDAIGAQTKITAITKESNERRKKLGEANTALEAFSGIDDPAAALDAMQKIGSLDDKHKADMDSYKDSINKTWEAKQAEWETEKSKLNDDLFDATTGQKFATSKVVKTTVLPPDIAKATFGHMFSPDGSAKDWNGNPIYSKSKPGEPASFDEAMETIIDGYEHKDSILKATGAQGSGGHEQGQQQQQQQTTQSSTEKIAAGIKERS